MTPPVRPERPQVTGVIDKVRKAQQAGYSMDEITAFLEQSGHAPYAQTLRDAKQGSVGMDGVQAAQGAFSGFGDEVMAAGGTLASKIIGDDRPWGEVYTTLRDDVRAKQRINQEANQIRAGAAQVAGALAAGKALPMPNVRLPGTLTSTAKGRLLNSAATGALQGGVAGYGSADTDRLEGAAMGAGFGAAGGAMFSAGADFMRKGIGTARSALRAPAVDAPPILPPSSSTAVATRAEPSMLDRVRASTGRPPAPRQPAPDVGARRAIQRLDRQGITTAQLAERSTAADGPDILAETMGERGIRDLRTARMMGHRAPDQIGTALDERAGDELARFQQTHERSSGFGARDATSVQDDARATGNRLAGPLFKQTADLQAPAEEVRGIASMLHGLEQDGINIWRKARAAVGGEFPRSPMADQNGQMVPIENMTVGQLRTVRQTLDGAISYGDSERGLNSIERAGRSRLMATRDAVDRLVKSAGGESAQEADATFAASMRRGEAFQQGERAGLATSEEQIGRMRADAGDDAAFREGRASDVSKKIQRARDGGAGAGVQNPVASTLGTPLARAATRAAYETDEGFNELQRVGEGVSRRLRTRNTVTGGSQTAEKLADATESVADPQMIQQLMSGNVPGAGMGLLTRGYVAAGRKLVGEEMDEYSRYLLAGAPGQMSREEATRRLAAMEPALRAQWAQQVMARGRTAGTVAGSQAGPRR